MSLTSYTDYLRRQREKGLERALTVHPVPGSAEELHFCSNDYLGLSQHPAVIKAFQQGLEKYGAGSGGSPLVCGYQKPHAELCEALAEWLQRDRVILFNSGYAANQGILGAFSDPGTHLLFDKLNHASLYDGAAVSASPLTRFKHNDLMHLRHRLQCLPQEQEALVVSEGVFSMDGDTLPLAPCLSVLEAEQKNRKSPVWLMVDDAHGLGVTASGRGVAGQACQQKLPLITATFGKAFGVAGAMVACSNEVADYLLQRARHLIYSTAFSAAQACAVLAALRIIQNDTARHQQLKANIAQFRTLAERRKLSLLPSETAIQPLIIGSNEAALRVSTQLRSRGVLCSAIRPPTVPSGKARLRFTLTASHTEKDIACLFSALDDIAAEHGRLEDCAI